MLLAFNINKSHSKKDRGYIRINTSLSLHCFSSVEWVFFRLFLKQNGLEFIKKKKPRDDCRLTYTLNIIDTTGFGDTREIDSDQGTIDQIQQLFSERGANWVIFLDADFFYCKSSIRTPYIFSNTQI